MTLRVIVADANEVARRFAARVARDAFRETVEVLECADAASAAAAWGGLPSQGERRLALIDVGLPPGGVERLLAAQAPDTLKVVTMLYADDEALLPLLQAGADGYLLKEDRYEALVEQLQRIAQGWPPVTPALARGVLALLGQRPGDGGGATTLGDDEARLLTHLSRGLTLREVAQQMKTEPRMVASQLRGIYRKLRRPLPTR